MRDQLELKHQLHIKSSNVGKTDMDREIISILLKTIDALCKQS